MPVHWQGHHFKSQRLLDCVAVTGYVSLCLVFVLRGYGFPQGNTTHDGPLECPNCDSAHVSGCVQSARILILPLKIPLKIKLTY
jgi:hypothetical protein